MSTLFWIVVAVALIWVVWKLSRSAGSSAGDGDSGTFFAADGGSTGTSSEADCSDSGSGGESCDGGGDGGGGGD